MAINPNSDRDYINSYGVDAVRYFALREVPFGNDGSFSEEALILRTNSDLCNILGNLVSRTIQMAIKYFDGNITNKNIIEDIDNELINDKNKLKNIVDSKINDLKINEALEAIFEILRKCNKYIDDTTPWVLAKDESNNDRLETIIYNLLDSIRVCAILLQAFIPTTSNKILDSLHIYDRKFENINNTYNYELGLEKPENLFERIKID